MSGPGCADQRGSVLLMLLVVISLLGLLAGMAGSSWKTVVQRAKEEDLLWKGDQIRRAIGSYYEFAGAGAKNNQPGKQAKVKAYPESLEDLLEDPRALETTRHLRRLYPDPMTGEEWEPIRNQSGGGIVGVRSRSELMPFKQQGFTDENKSFAAKSAYRYWAFIYTPTTKKDDQNSDTPSAPAQKAAADSAETAGK